MDESSNHIVVFTKDQLKEFGAQLDNYLQKANYQLASIPPPPVRQHPTNGA